MFHQRKRQKRLTGKIYHVHGGTLRFTTFIQYRIGFGMNFVRVFGMKPGFVFGANPRQYVIRTPLREAIVSSANNSHGCIDNAGSRSRVATRIFRTHGRKQCNTDKIIIPRNIRLSFEQMRHGWDCIVGFQLK